MPIAARLLTSPMRVTGSLRLGRVIATDAYAHGAPGYAATLLAGAVEAGIRPGDDQRALLRRLAAPILGG